MVKQSKFQKCEAIYAEMVTTTDKLPASERKKVVEAFISRAGCKPGSANVYFSHIRNGPPTPVAAELPPVSQPSPTVQVVDNSPTVDDYYDANEDYDDSDVTSMMEEAFR